MRRLVLFAALAGTLALVIFDFIRDQGSTSASNRATADLQGAGTKGEGSLQSGAGGDPRLHALPERSHFGEFRARIFGSHDSQPPALKSAAVLTSAPAPTAPPMPYRFSGKLMQDGKLEVFLSKGDSVVAVQQGETIEGGYRVESIGEEQITLTYLPLGKKETIPVFSLLPAAASDPAAGAAPIAPAKTDAVAAAGAARENKPAQLLWEGPQQVRLGSRFEVALKVTSGQPLHASPMQLRFDPAFLELVTARPGKFFGGGGRNFSYRANPDGSIFVGASSQSPAPATAAELLILTFKPLKLAPVAELSVASLNLQGAAGRPIAFEPLAAFKTAITP